MEWLLAWLIVTALFVVWRFVVSSEVEIRDPSDSGEGIRHAAFSTERRPRL
jgi:hypothetical protein